MTGEEMERAIEFLLKNQANFEARQEKTDEQIAQTNRQFEIYAETQTELIQAVLRFTESQDAINTSTRQRLSELTEAQQSTQQSFSVLADMQRSTQQKISDLAEMQQRTQQEISDLTKAVNNLINFSFGNGNSRQE